MDEREKLLSFTQRMIAAGFVLSAEKLQDLASNPLILQYLQQGRPDLIMGIIEANAEAAFLPFGQALTESYVASGKYQASIVPKLPKPPVPFPGGLRLDTEIYFDQANPNLMAGIEGHKRNLIQQLSTETRETVRQVLSRTITEGTNPLDAAREIRQHIGLTRFQDRAVSNFRQALMGKSPTQALSRALRDKRFDATIINSVKNNKPLSTEQIDKMVTRYRERYIKYRSETIARTESIRSLNYSGQSLWEDMAAKGEVDEKKVKRDWIYTKDGKTREEHGHNGIPYLNPDGVGLKEPFRAPGGRTILYPGDPRADASLTINCRCTVFFSVDYLSED